MPEFHALLTAAGVSRPWLARHVGLSRTMVDRWCAGQSEPPTEVVAWLERRLADPPPRRAA